MSIPSAASILLANRNPKAPLTPYDGKVGAIIGNCIYTTPNETFIPLPLYGNREVLVRKDYRYGPDDHTLWPQPYSSLVPHLAVIPRKPIDPNHPLAPLWSNPQESHFLPLSQGTIASGLGRLDSAFLETIKPIATSLHDRFDAYADSLSKEKDPKEPNKVAAGLAQISSFALRRLVSFVTSWLQIRFTVTELQRLLLELHGCLDYLEIYKPMIDSSRSTTHNPQTVNTIGTFTTSIRVVEEFCGVGVPVWFIRPCHRSGFGNNVLAEVKALDYRESLVMDAHPHFPPVFKGTCDADSSSVINHVHLFSCHWLKSPDPFAERAPASSLSASSQPTRPVEQQGSSSSSTSSPAISSTSSRHPDGKPPAKKLKTAVLPAKRPGRDKFQELNSPDMPFPIPAWATQLGNVDRSQPPAIERQPRGGFYTFPDPGLFIGVQTDRKRQLMVERYCRIGDVWLSRTHEAQGMAMTNDQWRNLLSIDFCLPPVQWAAGETKTAQRLRVALNELFPAGCTPRAINHDEPYILFGPEESYPTGTLPSHNSLRKFTFILYWLNFQSEVISLDRLAHMGLTSEEAMLQCEFEIRGLFPVETFQVPLFDPPNFGLAADSLRERLPFLRTFARIMSSWKGDKPRIFYLGRHHSGADESIPLDQAAELEQEVAKFYCQNFFNYFRRAAQIPHRLYAPSPGDK